MSTNAAAENAFGSRELSGRGARSRGDVAATTDGSGPAAGAASGETAVGRAEPRPLALLTRYGRAYPRAAKMAAEAHDSWSRGPGFRDFSYFPLYDVTNRIARAHGAEGRGRVERDPNDYLTALEALLRWRLTKGVYAFDRDVFAALAAMPLEGELPVDLFFRLPERCVYIETPPGAALSGDHAGMLGFFAYLGRDELRRVTELVFAPDFGDGALRGYSVDLTSSTLDGCLARWRATLLASNGALDLIERTAGKAARGRLEDPEAAREDRAREVAFLGPFVSLVLYLCARNSEVDAADGSAGRPRDPVPRRAKKGKRKVFAAQGVSRWDVAWREGARLCERRRAETERRAAGTGAGRGVGAHWRRAHWHGYWTGPRDEPEGREFVLKWLPPVPVNFRPGEEDDLPAVVRRVGGETHGKGAA